MAVRNYDYDLDAVIDDLRDGKPYSDIQAAHDVSGSVLSRIARAHDLSRQGRRSPGPAPTPEQACSGCAARTWSANGVCRQCRDEGMCPAPEALPGAWVIDLRRRVVVYQEAS